MTKVVALYCRISPRPDGSYEGVDVQKRAGHRYADRTWPGVPVNVFPDAGISAANGDHRPQFEALREAIRRGKVAHVWVVEQSRLERTEVGWFTLAAELDAAGIAEVHTDRDGIVRVLDDVAGVKAVLAAGEVRKLRQRTNAKLADLAAEGRPAGGAVFGYRRTVDDAGHKALLVDEGQAAILRECADRVLAGWSLSRIADDLVGRGVTGIKGGAVTAWTVRSMLTNPTVAGLRTYRGEVVGRGVWEPILDQPTWHAVKAKLSQPRTVVKSTGQEYPVSGESRYAGRRYLLTGGVAVCAECDAPLVASIRTRRTKTFSSYMCHSKAGGRGCVDIRGEALEAYVVGELLDELDKPAFWAAVAADDHGQVRERLLAELAELEETRRPELARMWARRELTVAEWRAAREDLDAQEAQLRRDLAGLPPPAVAVDPGQLRAGWAAMNLDERREIVGMFIARVAVKRARPGLKQFDPGRVSVEWRTR